jgi:hypothetical protein
MFQRLTSEKWAAIITAAAAVAGTTTPNLRSWWVAGPLWVLVVLSVVRWLRATTGPIRARIEVVWPQEWRVDEQRGVVMTFPVQIVNREADALVFRVTFEIETERATHDCYVVTLDGGPPHGLVTVAPDTPVTLTAEVWPFVYPVPPSLAHKVSYPAPSDHNRIHRLTFQEFRHNRTAIVTVDEPYDVV